MLCSHCIATVIKPLDIKINNFMTPSDNVASALIGAVFIQYVLRVSVPSFNLSYEQNSCHANNTALENVLCVYLQLWIYR